MTSFAGVAGMRWSSLQTAGCDQLAVAISLPGVSLGMGSPFISSGIGALDSLGP